jgi:CRISPR-associated protein Csb2
VLAIEVELLHGTIRAGSPDDTALTGGDDPGEWPPSPAQLFAAFVAADGTRDRSRVTDGSELAVLEGAPAPVVLADGPDDVLGSAQLGRYVVQNGRAANSVQEYVGRANTLVRPSTRLNPKSPMVTYVWPDLQVSDEHLVGLRARAARIGYLGCADSPARVRVSADYPPDRLHAAARRWEPSPRGSAFIPVPFPGLLQVLDRMYDDFSSGTTPRRTWYRTERARYIHPGERPVDDRPAPEMFWLRFDRTASGRHVLHVTEALRDAVLAAYQRHVTGEGNEIPAVLHGHGFDGTRYDHASWLALPDVGHPHASGRIHGAAVVLPPGADPEVVEGVRSALWRVRRLRIATGLEVTVAPFEGQRRPWACHPKRWTATAKTWVSAFPVVHERWSKTVPDLAEVRRWCRNAGVTEPPVAARLVRTPVVPGAVDLMPHEANRGDERRPYSHLLVEFAQKVRGPLVLGRLRHFGLGVMVPLPAADGRLDGGS